MEILPKTTGPIKEGQCCLVVCGWKSVELTIKAASMKNKKYFGHTMAH